ncbi:MFS transporter [Rhodococcus qingshengii]|uniref:MFS transporter n=1 Tax=Rhodococcus qingshengii TaxID=334542 RepID=UPI0036DCE919
MQSTPPAQKRAPRVVLAACFVALCLEGYDLTVYGTVVPSLLAYEPWGLTPAGAGRLAAMAVAGMLVGALAASMVMDRVGRRAMLIACVTLFSVATGVSAIVDTPGQFGVLRFVTGIGAGGLMPAVVALVVEFSPPRRRSWNSAIVFAGVGVGGALAGLFSMWLVPDHGFRIVFAIAAAPVIIVLPFLLLALPESPAHLLSRGRIDEAQRVAARYGTPPPLETRDAVAGTREDTSKTDRRSAIAAILGSKYRRATVLFWLTTFLCLLVLFGTSAWLPTLMRESGYGLSSAISFLLVMSLGATVGTLAVSPLADRFGSKPVVSAGFFAAAVALALLAVHPPTPVVYVLVALAGLGSTGTQVLLNAYVGAYYPTSARATALGLSLGIGRLGGIAGPLLGGMILTDLSSVGQFLAFAVPAALGGLLVLAVPAVRTEESSPNDATESASVGGDAATVR